ncbi:MAG: nucleotidyltransferase family protein [Flavobacteriales bacterium]|nr:nucleotidyltransferase family protein [Flavobacteriales bacterium]
MLYFEVEITAVDQLIFLGSKLQLSEDERKTVARCCAEINDWNLLVTRAIGSHIAPILFQTLSEESTKALVPPGVLSKFSNLQNQVLVRNMRLQQVFLEMLDLLNEAQIPVVPLKGIYLSEKVYRNLSLRHLSDIDVLIKKEHLQRVCELMQQRGWDAKWAQGYSKTEAEHFAKAHPCTLVKNGMQIELHTHLYDGNQGAKITSIELWTKTEPEDFLGFYIHQFSPELLAQHLCLHLHKHLFGPDMKLLSFCDIREFLLQHPEFDWKYFGDLCMKYDCAEPVSQVLFVCQKYWHVVLPAEFSLGQFDFYEADQRFVNHYTGRHADRAVYHEARMTTIQRRITSLDSSTERIAVVFGIIFPDATFMRSLYRLPEGQWLWPWYIYRPMQLSYKLALALIGRIAAKK